MVGLTYLVRYSQYDCVQAKHEEGRLVARKIGLHV